MAKFDRAKEIISYRIKNPVIKVACSNELEDISNAHPEKVEVANIFCGDKVVGLDKRLVSYYFIVTKDGRRMEGTKINGEEYETWFELEDSDLDYLDFNTGKLYFSYTLRNENGEKYVSVSDVKDFSFGGKDAIALFYSDELGEMNMFDSLEELSGENLKFELPIEDEIMHKIFDNENIDIENVAVLFKKKEDSQTGIEIEVLTPTMQVLGTYYI